MNNFKRTAAAAIVAGTMALTFAGGASADGPKPAPTPSAPAGSVTFFVNGAPSNASFNPYEIALVKKVPVAPPEAASLAQAPLTMTQAELLQEYDNEWKYIAIRRY